MSSTTASSDSSQSSTAQLSHSLCRAELTLSWSQRGAKVERLPNRADCYGNICLFGGGGGWLIALFVFSWVTNSEYKLCGLLWRAQGCRGDNVSLAWTNKQATSSGQTSHNPSAFQSPGGFSHLSSVVQPATPPPPPHVWTALIRSKHLTVGDMAGHALFL